MKKVLKYFLNNEVSPVSMIELLARTYLGYVMVVNSRIGITVPLEDLGLPERAYVFIKALWDSGYLMHLTKGIELLAGLALILNAWVPLALVVLAPVLVNIFCIGFTVLPGAWTRSLPFVLITLFLAYRNRTAYAGLFQYSRGQSDQRLSGPVGEEFSPVSKEDLVLKNR